MPFTSWKTYASGDVDTAADANTYTRDNGRWLSHNATGGAPTCLVYNSANQTISTATDTVLNFDSEVYDLAGMHSVSSNTSRLTAPSGAGGIYLVGANISWDSVASPSGLRQISLRADGATTFAASSQDAFSGANQATFMSISSLWKLTASTGYVETLVRHTQGANLDVLASSAGNYKFSMWALWVGEA